MILQVSMRFRLSTALARSGVTMGGGRGGRPPRVQVKSGAQKELTGTFLYILSWVKWLTKGGTKLGFSGNFVRKL